MLFRRAHGKYEKPIFVLAALRYMLKTNTFGIGLLDLLRAEHKQRVKSHFEFLADRRLANPAASWNNLTSPMKREMKDAVEKYIAKEGDVSEAFSELTETKAKSLFDMFLRKLDEAPKPHMEELPD